MTKVRKDRNPRYTKALDLAEVNNDLMKANSSHNYSMRMRVIGLDKKVTSLVEELQPRNGKLTDAYLKYSLMKILMKMKIIFPMNLTPIN